MMRLFLLLIISFSAFSQPYLTNKRDSLLHVLINLKDGHSKITVLYALGSLEQDPNLQNRISFVRKGISLAKEFKLHRDIVNGYQLLAKLLSEDSNSNMDSCLYYIDQSYSIASENNYKREQVYALIAKSKMMERTGEQFKSLAYLEEASTLAIEVNENDLLSEAYRNLSRGYSLVDLDSASFRYAQKALSVIDSTEFPQLYGKALNTVAICYEEFKNFKAALQYYNYHLRMAERLGEYRDQGMAMLNISNIYNELGNPQKSLLISRQIMNFTRRHKLRRLEAISNASIGYRYSEMGIHYDSAIYYLAQANKIWDELSFSNTDYYADIWTEMAECEFNMGHHEKAIALLKKSYALSKSIKAFGAQKNALLLLSKVYADLNDFRKVYEYQSELLKTMDSIRSDEYVKSMARIEFRFDLEKSAKEKKLLALENENAKSYIEQKNIEQIFLFAITILSVLGVAVFIQLYRQKTKANQELEIKSRTIEQQKEELHSTLDHNLKIQNQLVQSDKMASLGQLTAGIAHELNNPLNFINGGVTALADVHQEVILALKNKSTITEDQILGIEEEFSSLMKSIETGVNRSTAIIKSLRTFSNPLDEIHDGSRTNLNNCVVSSLILLNSKITDKLVKIEKDVDEHHTAIANESMISQVIINLMDNAIHALEDKVGDRIITIRTELVGAEVLVYIKDNGAGIATEHQQHILNPFFTTKEVGKGTGLGLSISYGIIQKHQGKLTFTSNVGVGTEFIITLPAAI